MALDLPLPDQVFGHGWLIIEGNKISKSLGNYRDPREYIEKYSVDAVRYFSLREIPFGNDGNFSEEALVARINADLANTWGNLVNRTIGMANKYFEGTIRNRKNGEAIDELFIESLKTLKNKTDEKIDDLQISKVLEEIFDVLRSSNKYIDDTTPWVLAKDESKKERLETVLYNLLESIRITNILLKPFMPESTEKVDTYLKTERTSFEDAIYIDDLIYEVTDSPEPLFERIQKEEN